MMLKSCCGKKICVGCVYSMVESEEGDRLCAFCRTPRPTSDGEEVGRLKKLMEKGNGNAFLLLASYYYRGTMGMSQDMAKANE